MAQKQKAATRGLRYDAELGNRIEVARQRGEFSCSSAFIRAAIERELAGRESGVDAAEQRIAASLDRMAREIRNLRLGQQALFAFVDVLAKTFLTCVPEPPRDAHDQAVARGKARYDRFLKSVGMAMVGDSQAALAELLGLATKTEGERGFWIRPRRPRPSAESEAFAWPSRQNCRPMASARPLHRP
jgi:hypothetical protein